ncbi:MAG TPA: Crp/Fnr family transcriptional regulator [Vicinamibacterales bacterium]|nr:Crp/Fnr family transcriptional regulator [Vicinamibacterales bacterium]
MLRDRGRQSEEDVVALLRNGPLAALPRETVERLATDGTEREVAEGVTVYTEAETERFAVVLNGLIRVYMNTSDGREVTVRYVRTGELLGAPALIAGPAPVFVQAVTNSSLYFMDVARVKALAQRDAAVAWVFAQESVHRLYDILEELAGNTFATVRQRVVRHLLDLASSRATGDGRLTALVNQQDLANSVGSVREVVARVLHELREASLVRTSPGRVEILEPVKMSRELWSRVRD